MTGYIISELIQWSIWCLSFDCSILSFLVFIDVDCLPSSLLFEMNFHTFSDFKRTAVS